MVAKITLEFDDQTAPGFQQLVRNLEASDLAARGLAVATDQNNEALAILQQQNMQTVAAIQQTTAAVQANRDSFFESANAVIDFGGHLAHLGIVAVGAFGKFAKESAKIVEARTNLDVTGTAAKHLALRMAGIAAPVAVSVAALKTMTVVLEHTGKKVIPEFNKANQDLADQINNGSKTIQQVVEETGKSMEELGLTSQTNWSIVKEEMGKTSKLAGSDLKNLAVGIGEVTGITQAVKDAWEGIGEFATKETKRWQLGMEVLREEMDQLMGRSTELRKQQEKMAEQAKFEAPIRKRFETQRKALDRQLDLEREVAKFQEIKTHEDVERVRSAEMEKLNHALRTRNIKEGMEEAFQKKFEALMRRHLEIDKETAEAAIRNAKEVAEATAKAEKERLEAAQKRAEEEAKLREEAAKAEQEYREEVARGQEELALQEQKHQQERQIERLKRVEGNEAKITEILKQQLEERADLESNFAKSASEAERIEWELKRDLRELDHQHAIATEQKKFELRQKALADAREKFQAEIDLLKQKLEQEKRLQSGGTQTELGKIVGQFSKEQVREEIVQNRLQAGASREGRAGVSGRRLTEAEIRRMVIREMRTGGIDPKETQAAQIDLIQQTAMTGLKTGKLGKTTANALYQAATNQEQTNRELDRHEADIQRIFEFFRIQGDEGRRRQSQRRGFRR